MKHNFLTDCEFDFFIFNSGCATQFNMYVLFGWPASYIEELNHSLKLSWL